MIRHAEGNPNDNAKGNAKQNYAICSSAKQCFRTSIGKQLKENAVPIATSLVFWHLYTFIPLIYPKNTGAPGMETPWRFFQI